MNSLKLFKSLESPELKCGDSRLDELPLTICVGGVSLGGAGKTQVIHELARRASSLGLKVAVLCHAYRGIRRARPCLLSEPPPWGDLTWGDEAAMLRRWLPSSVKLWCGGGWLDKWESARFDHPDLILCDGGLYTSNLPRHMGVLTISPRMRPQLLPRGESTRPQSMWPRGPGYLWWWIHDPKRLNDDSLPSSHVTQMMSERMHALGVHGALYSRVEALEWVNRAQEVAPLAGLSDQDAGLICAIARPSRFVELVAQCGVHVTHEIIARDHAPLDHRLKNHLKDLLKKNLCEAVSDSPRLWVTTLKDLVKLSPELDEHCELWGLRVRLSAPRLYRAFRLMGQVDQASADVRADTQDVQSDARSLEESTPDVTSS